MLTGDATHEIRYNICLVYLHALKPELKTGLSDVAEAYIGCQFNSALIYLSECCECLLNSDLLTLNKSESQEHTNRMLMPCQLISATVKLKYLYL